MSSRNTPTPKNHVVDWRTAQRIGELIAGINSDSHSPTITAEDLRKLLAPIQPLAHDFAQRVSKYSRLKLTTELPTLEMVDRATWIAANLKTMRSLLEPLSGQL